MNKLKELLLSYFKNLFNNKLKSVVKFILWIASIIVIVMILKFFGFFKQEPIKPPIIPGQATNESKPSKDSKDIVNDIQKQIDFLKGKKR